MQEWVWLLSPHGMAIPLSDCLLQPWGGGGPTTHSGAIGIVYLLGGGGGGGTPAPPPLDLPVPTDFKMRWLAIQCML